MNSAEKRHPRAVAPMRESRRDPLRGAALVLGLGVLVAAQVARADSITAEVIGGWQNLQPSTGSVGNAIGGREGTGIVGGDVIGGFGGFGLGAAVDKTVSGSAQPWAGSIMAGFLFELPLSLRVDALGEIGRRAHDFDEIFRSSGATFVGLRPGVSFRLGLSPVRLGVTGLARWPTSGGSLGSPDYGVVGRIGVGP